jgi:hypothetical protein
VGFGDNDDDVVVVPAADDVELELLIFSANPPDGCTASNDDVDVDVAVDGDTDNKLLLYIILVAASVLILRLLCLSCRLFPFKKFEDEVV